MRPPTNSQIDLYFGLCLDFWGCNDLVHGFIDQLWPTYYWRVSVSLQKRSLPHWCCRITPAHRANSELEMWLIIPSLHHWIRKVTVTATVPAAFQQWRPPTKSSGCGGLLDRLRRKASNWYLGKWATKPAHHWHFHGCMVWRHICILAGQDWFECFGRHVPEKCLDWRFLHNMFPIL